MIGGILILNNKGNSLISRIYRDTITAKAATSAFKNQILAAKINDRCPVRTIGSTTFAHITYQEIFFVAVCRKNVNAAMVFQFLHKLVHILRVYFDNKLTEENIRENFVLVYEILDEILDFGYPQNTEPTVLQTYITGGKYKEPSLGDIKQIISGVTGAVSWRNPNIKYKKNELFIDVVEQVNMLLSSQGNILHSDVSGKIMMKSFLSGMPECKFGLNDKLMMQGERRTNRPGQRYKEISISDVVFHQCVRLGKFDADRTISFIPPDGEFELMRYRITDSVIAPFRLLSPIVRELGKTRLEVQVSIKSVFSANLFGKNVTVKIPLPKNTANCKVRVAAGSAKYKAQEGGIIWVIKRFPGDTESSLSADVELISHTLQNKKTSMRPPISLQFQVPMFTSSGLHVRFLKIYEKSNYQSIKWVRYLTQAGTFEQRV